MCFIIDALSENVRHSCVSFLNVCWFQFAPPSEHSASGHFISSVAMYQASCLSSEARVSTGGHV